MTQDDDSAAPLSPAEEREISRLLGDAGGSVDMPPDVADRLSGVLADLAEERSVDTSVVPLRTRRRWPAALLAAAAVVVGGYAVGNLVGDGSLTASDGGDAARPESAVERGDAGGAADEDSSTAGDRELTADAPRSRRVARLRSDRLEADVLRVLSAVPPLELRRDTLSQNYDGALKAGCRPTELDRRDTWFRARYDGEPAVLILGPERSDTVGARVFSCDGELLDSTTVPAP